MKYLLLFLISFNLYAVCNTQTEANINSCTIEDVSWIKSEEKLDAWKTEKIAELQERQRVSAVKARIESIGGKFGKHGSFQGTRKHMEKCGYSYSNEALFIKEAMKAENTAMIDCLESKKAEVDAEDAAEEAKKNTIKTVRDRMKLADCSSLSGQLLQDMCIILKGR